MGNQRVAEVISKSDESTEVMDLVSTECTRKDPGEVFPSGVRSHKESTEVLSYGPFVYREDIVNCKTKGLLGIVQEVAGDADSDSDLDDDCADNDDDDNEDDKDVSVDNDDGGGDYEGTNHDCDDNGNNGDDEDEDDSLKDGQVRIIWLDNSETTNSLSEITVVDRGFLHGDIVSSVTDPTGQLGVVTDVHIFVDLQSADGSIIKDVSSKVLQRVREFAMGDYVVLGHWLGRVDEVVDNVTVLFDDGSCCKVLKTNPTQVKPVSKNTIEDANFPYHPGQRVRATSLSVFKTSRWLSGAWKANRVEGTVTKVQAGSVFVYWMASANPGFGSESTGVPREEQKPKDLTLLSCFTHASWQLGDWCLLQPSFYESSQKSAVPDCNQHSSNEGMNCNGRVVADLTDKDQHSLAETDSEQVILAEHSLGQIDSEQVIPDTNLDENVRTLENKPSIDSGSCSHLTSVPNEPVHDGGTFLRKKLCKVVIRKDKKRRRKGETFQRAFQIVNTKTKVDVVWQDGSRELGRDSTTLIPNESPGDQEFCPGQYVVEKASDEVEDGEVKRVGVVRTMNAKDRTAHVRWLKPVARPEDPREFDNEELVSVYELEEHPDYDYCYGDLVVRLSPVFSTGGEPHSEYLLWDQEREELSKVDTSGTGISKGQSENSKEISNTDATSPSLSWVGNITGLEDGDIEVTWADGMVSKVGPQAIYVVGRDDEDGNDFSVNDAASWETFEGSEDELENDREKVKLQNTDDNQNEMEKCTTDHPEENNAARSGPLSIPLAALGFVTRLASGLFLRGRNGPVSTPILGSDAKHSNESECSESERDANDELSSEDSNAKDNHTAETTHETREESSPLSGPSGPEENVIDGMIQLACYVDDSCSFKHFDIAKEPEDHHFLAGGELNMSGGKKWFKKIQQDWSILEKNLPNDIYVRVYEDRMDLLRAVIVGAYGTPYQDGLFFFDFQLQPEYPQVPPSAYYHSSGLRINPNLYEDGKVCLSLLNTWNGKGNEVWDPSSSSILQVLVSLQGLVLNSKPYFNEAGYDKQVGTAEGEKNSLSYNENTFLLNCKTMLYILRRPPKHFEEVVKQHFQTRGPFILKACDEYMKGSLVGSLTTDACRSERSGEDSNSIGFKLMLGKLVPRLISALSEVRVDCLQYEHLQQS
ncbi:probable ubiquitin-conjugating enzyme E2 23 [Aristolochia californica]|uniref:probable ubiquitin-conjugating enzyme E2 23 n=1 Tax=Aristolochia californica TaxID=171875 RepID=UPI0035DE6B41